MEFDELQQLLKFKSRSSTDQRLIVFIKKLYATARKDYIESQEFKKAVKKTYKAIEKDVDRFYVHVQNFVAVLKQNQQGKKRKHVASDDEPTKRPCLSSDVSDLSEKSNDASLPGSGESAPAPPSRGGQPTPSVDPTGAPGTSKDDSNPPSDSNSSTSISKDISQTKKSTEIPEISRSATELITPTKTSSVLEKTEILAKQNVSNGKNRDTDKTRTEDDSISKSCERSAFTKVIADSDSNEFSSVRKDAKVSNSGTSVPKSQVKSLRRVGLTPVVVENLVSEIVKIVDTETVPETDSVTLISSGSNSDAVTPTSDVIAASPTEELFLPKSSKLCAKEMRPPSSLSQGCQAEIYMDHDFELEPCESQSQNSQSVTIPSHQIDYEVIDSGRNDVRRKRDDVILGGTSDGSAKRRVAMVSLPRIDYEIVGHPAFRENPSKTCKTRKGVTSSPKPSTSQAHVTSSPEAEDDELPVKRDLVKGNKRQVRKLEKMLKKLNKAITHIQEREIPLDDLGREDSYYMQEDKLKKRFVKVWKKLCELHGQTAGAGRKEDKKFRYEGTRYPEINRAIERFVNKKRFPDIHDVKNVVRKANEKFHMRFSEKMIRQTAQTVFIEVGKMMKKRRMDDFTMDFGCELTDNGVGDPASEDEPLRQKLDINYEVSTKNLNEVFAKFTRRQEDGYDFSDEYVNPSEEEEQIYSKKKESPKKEESQKEGEKSPRPSTSTDRNDNDVDTTVCEGEDTMEYDETNDSDISETKTSRKSTNNETKTSDKVSEDVQRLGKWNMFDSDSSDDDLPEFGSTRKVLKALESESGAESDSVMENSEVNNSVTRTTSSPMKPQLNSASKSESKSDSAVVKAKAEEESESDESSPKPSVVKSVPSPVEISDDIDEIARIKSESRKEPQPNLNASPRKLSPSNAKEVLDLTDSDLEPMECEEVESENESVLELDESEEECENARSSKENSPRTMKEKRIDASEKGTEVEVTLSVSNKVSSPKKMSEMKGSPRGVMAHLAESSPKKGGSPLITSSPKRSVDSPKKTDSPKKIDIPKFLPESLSVEVTPAKEKPSDPIILLSPSNSEITISDSPCKPNESISNGVAKAKEFVAGLSKPNNVSYITTPVSLGNAPITHVKATTSGSIATGVKPSPAPMATPLSTIATASTSGGSADWSDVVSKLICGNNAKMPLPIGVRSTTTQKLNTNQKLLQQKAAAAAAVRKQVLAQMNPKSTGVSKLVLAQVNPKTGVSNQVLTRIDPKSTAVPNQIINQRVGTKMTTLGLAKNTKGSTQVVRANAASNMAPMAKKVQMAQFPPYNGDPKTAVAPKSAGPIPIGPPIRAAQFQKMVKKVAPDPKNILKQAQNVSKKTFQNPPNTVQRVGQNASPQVTQSMGARLPQTLPKMASNTVPKGAPRLVPRIGTSVVSNTSHNIVRPKTGQAQSVQPKLGHQNATEVGQQKSKWTVPGNETVASTSAAKAGLEVSIRTFRAGDSLDSDDVTKTGPITIEDSPIATKSVKNDASRLLDTGDISPIENSDSDSDTPTMNCHRRLDFGAKNPSFKPSVTSTVVKPKLPNAALTMSTNRTVVVSKNTPQTLVAKTPQNVVRNTTQGVPKTSVQNKSLTKSKPAAGDSPSDDDPVIVLSDSE